VQRSTGGVFRKAELAARGCKREEREAKETGRERRDDVLTVIGCSGSLNWSNCPVADSRKEGRRGECRAVGDLGRWEREEEEKSCRWKDLERPSFVCPISGAGDEKR
jgi:hypothetical protein